MKLTKTAATQVTVLAGKAEVIAWDDSIPGFGLRARAGGSRNWIFQYRQGRKQRRISVGAASAMTTEAARQRAAQLHAEVKLGRDPAGQKFEDRARAHETFDLALPLYLSHKNATLRPRSYIGVERHLRFTASHYTGCSSHRLANAMLRHSWPGSQFRADLPPPIMSAHR